MCRFFLSSLSADVGKMDIVCAQIEMNINWTIDVGKMDIVCAQIEMDISRT
jgi:hypothetical protein